MNVVEKVPCKEQTLRNNRKRIWRQFWHRIIKTQKAQVAAEARAVVGAEAEVGAQAAAEAVVGAGVRVVAAGINRTAAMMNLTVKLLISAASAK